MTENKEFYVYSKPNCPWCSLAEHVLEINKIKHEVFKENDPGERQVILLNVKENYEEAKDHNTYPIVFLINHDLYKPTFIGGCTELLDYLTKNGYTVY